MTRDGQDRLTQAQAALSRAELLLRTADELAATTSLVDIRRRVRNLVVSDLEPVYVSLVLAEGRRLRRVIDDEIPRTVETSARQYDVDPHGPTSEAFRRERMIELTDPVALRDGYGDAALAAFTDLGLKSAVCVPLPGVTGPVGVLVLGWDRAHLLDIEERAVLMAVAGYTARAVERAQLLAQRVTVAHQLQQAMLTDLPQVAGLEIAALYRPAMTADLVGGDWYDAYFLHLPGGAGHRPLAITVGDITGHDMQAATLMGQVRSMLRQADIDHLGRGPATSVTALERACRLVLPQATGSLVHGHLTPGPTGWELTWTNAGHPPPILVHPGGRVEELTAHDMMFFPTLESHEARGRRTESSRPLTPGTLLVMFTDGLIESPGVDLDAATARLLAALSARADLQSDRALPGLLEELAEEMAGAAGNVDDIVMLAVRVPAGRG
ncbi:serine/threonine protein phosphatase [Herbidospora galbida]|uniref:Serine/threonine protein phosphatase n=1 Tax=Herbidospora galbida TaxID=2575442 RepID=A0A4U3MQU8_9ACTN|nr:GAF domain-containing SpoIIE family protein phosphatase [Herbidospora galbida]TKK91279.1 serine/threonine protein phosphatase [Herbidospora galbida]